MARGSMLAGRGVGLVLLSRQLGGAKFGVYALLLTTYNIALSLGCFGIEQANLYLAGRRPRHLPALIGNSLLLGGFFGLLSGAAFLAAVVLLENRIFSDAPPGAVLLCAAMLPVAIVHNALSGIVVGLGRFRYYGSLEVMKWTGYLVILAALYARHDLDIGTALGCFFAVIVAATIVHFVVLAWRCSGRLRCSWRLLQRTLRIGREMLLVHLTHVMSLRLDVYAVRLLGSNLLAGRYALATNLGEILLYVARSFSLVVFSGTARGGQRTSLHVRSLVQWIVLAGLVLCTAVLAVRQDLLRLLFGETSEGCIATLAVRLPGVLAASISLLLCGELLGHGCRGLVVRGNMFAVATLAGLAWPLGAWNTTIGSALAFTVAMCVQLAWLVRARPPQQEAISARVRADWKPSLEE